jgi:hypothetical protein
MLPLYLTTHLVSVKMIFHPALHRIRIPIREAIDNPGTMCPVRVIGSPWMSMSHTCVGCMTPPFGRLMARGFVASQTLFIGVLAITNIDVALVSAMVCVVGIDNAFRIGRVGAITCGHDMFDVTIAA